MKIHLPKRPLTSKRLAVLKQKAFEAMSAKPKKRPTPTGLWKNPIIADLVATFDLNEFPGGIAAAIITNDLKDAVVSASPGTTWTDIEEAVRYVSTWVPVAKVESWRRRLRKGGRS